MSRPQKYTDSEIVAAAQALIAEGEEINPTRVRVQLGGGNVNRIKAIIAGMPRGRAPHQALAANVPGALKRELQHLTTEASREILLVVAKYWGTAPATSTNTMGEENERLRNRIEDLEAGALAASERIAVAENERSEKDAALRQLAIERDDLVRNLGSLQSALRNAEADVRAAQRSIDGIERNRREDREQIRDLHNRIEGMIGEIAQLTAKAAGPSQRERPRGGGSS
ncbi:DNA-binding protein [Bradyrhizobium sp. Tv2a-2]|uniref:DNA-binding protein n=1 Tax=Bradyrhizobium sp. Tv2a-2 TaxID=113395 RepID=UPI0004061A64|nr:DNA-binding protein [Bradyrhizobium sp. Tv2a-2]